MATVHLGGRFSVSKVRMGEAEAVGTLPAHPPAHALAPAANMCHSLPREWWAEWAWPTASSGPRVGRRPPHHCHNHAESPPGTCGAGKRQGTAQPAGSGLHTQLPASPFPHDRHFRNGQPSSSLCRGEMSRNPMVRVTRWWSLSQACMAGVQGDLPGVSVTLPSPTFLRALLL